MRAVDTPAIYALRFLCAPSADESRRMARELVALYSRRQAAFLCGVPAQTFNGWLCGSGLTLISQRRVVWYTWCLCLHPELIQTEFDLITWGRFRRLRKRSVKVSKVVVEDGSDWVI